MDGVRGEVKGGVERGVGGNVEVGASAHRAVRFVSPRETFTSCTAWHASRSRMTASRPSSTQSDIHCERARGGVRRGGREGRVGVRVGMAGVKQQDGRRQAEQHA